MLPQSDFEAFKSAVEFPLALIKRGIDRQQQERERLAKKEQKRKNTFAAVAEDFIAEKLPSERKGREVKRDIRRDFIPAWGKLPIPEPAVVAARDRRRRIKSYLMSTAAMVPSRFGARYFVVS